MAESIMPAAEAAIAIHDDERNSYELAFHILPTVAEGEVTGVFDAIKGLVEKAGGERFDEEAPERIDLAYDIALHVEGKNRAFHSAYFGWVRFRLASDAVEHLISDVEGRSDVLRYLLIKLTKLEEETPFRFHEARKSHKVETVEEREILTDASKETAGTAVSDKKLDESLERITDDSDVSDEGEKTDSIENK